ncbi:MAG: HDOD domain-containing protein [Ignavibacteriales bacterium]|nr:MAG: HDOD domain-containing protein [Ignavibacteriales bacterium]
MTNTQSNTKTAAIKKFNLESIRNLPSIPIVMLEVSRMLDNPATNASELGKVISTDQGMVAKILTVANSPLYGLPRRVSTIDFAIVVLGFDHIKNIVIALSMMEAFKESFDPAWNKKAYWVHSLTTASAAKRIADELGYRKSGEVFTAALLHDLGISVIQRYLHDDYKSICELVRQDDCSYLEAENEVMGLTHQEIGEFLADRWNLPSVLGDAIAHHHTPSQSKENKTLTSIIHLADYMTQRLNIGHFEWDNKIALDKEIISILNLGDENYLNNFIASYEKLFQSQLDSLNN